MLFDLFIKAINNIQNCRVFCSRLFCPFSIVLVFPTKIHGLLRGVSWNAPKHDAGQHSAEQQGKTARHTLHTSESAARRAVDDRKPYVAILKILGCLHEEQVTENIYRKRAFEFWRNSKFLLKNHQRGLR